MNIQGTLKNIVKKDTLKWVFVGGKGGVGKTTTSSSLATLLAQSGKKTLIISTDPAHNLSDCFDQKVTREPTQIKGITNLYAMQIQPKADVQKMTNDYSFLNLQTGQDQGTKSLMTQILSSVPGIDEAISFNQLVNSVQNMDYDIIVFDTAPTGHTLKFLNFPNIFEKGLNKILSLKQKFNGIIGGMSGLFGSKQSFQGVIDKMFNKMSSLKQSSRIDKTTFIAVCIPQFLPMYQTERLIQQLTKFQIDICNIVVNQVLFREDECKMCKSRSKMQKKYLDQIIQLYQDFHVTIMPLQQQQVRGPEKLKIFSKLLLQAKQPPK